MNSKSATRAERENGVDSGDEQSVLKAQSEAGRGPRDVTDSEADGSKSAPELDEPDRPTNSPDASKIGLDESVPPTKVFSRKFGMP